MIMISTRTVEIIIQVSSPLSTVCVGAVMPAGAAASAGAGQEQARLPPSVQLRWWLRRPPVRLSRDRDRGRGQGCCEASASIAPPALFANALRAGRQNH